MPAFDLSGTATAGGTPMTQKESGFAQILLGMSVIHRKLNIQ
jgi:hypothetical protein